MKNLVSKQIFARWQAILSCFDFQILPIKGIENPWAQESSYSKKKNTLRNHSSSSCDDRKKIIDKGTKPITFSNTPTPMTANSYAMDAGFTRVTRSKEKLAKKQTEVITPTRPSASSTWSSVVTPSRSTVSSTSKGPSVPSTYSDAVVPVRFSLVPKIMTYFKNLYLYQKLW